MPLSLLCTGNKFCEVNIPPHYFDRQLRLKPAGNNNRSFLQITFDSDSRCFIKNYLPPSKGEIYILVITLAGPE